ncbi:MAG: hypothetical protein ACK521_11095 [bacterium]
MLRFKNELGANLSKNRRSKNQHGKVSSFNRVSSQNSVSDGSDVRNDSRSSPQKANETQEEQKKFKQ